MPDGDGADRPGHAHRQRPVRHGSQGHLDPGRGQEDWHRHPHLLLPSEDGARCRLPHVPGRGREDAQIAAGVCRLRRRGHGGQDDHRPGHQVPEGRARVPADQPSARLPDLRQGRRMSAAGPDLSIRSGREPLPVRQGALRQGGAALRQDPSRPRALHSLLALHPLQRRNLWGARAGPDPAWRPHHHRHLQRRAGPVQLPGQLDGDLPSGGLDLAAVPVHQPALGSGPHTERLPRMQHGLQHPDRCPEQQDRPISVTREPRR